MNQLIYFFISILSVNTTENCKLDEKDFPNFELQYKSSKAPIEVNAPDAKIVSCSPWKSFPQLLVVEIDLGGAGTSALTHQTDLVIYDTSTKTLKEIFRKMIREKSEKKNETTSFEEPYRLEKTKTGKPAIRWTRSNNLTLIKID